MAVDEQNSDGMEDRDWNLDFLPARMHVDVDPERILASDYLMQAVDAELKKVHDQDLKREKIDKEIHFLCFRAEALKNLKERFSDGVIEEFEQTFFGHIKELIFKDPILSWDAPSLFDYFTQELEKKALNCDSHLRRCLKDEHDFKVEDFEKLNKALGAKNVYPEFIENWLKTMAELESVDVANLWHKKREVQFEVGQCVKKMADIIKQLPADRIDICGKMSADCPKLNEDFFHAFSSLFSSFSKSDLKGFTSVLHTSFVDVLGFSEGEGSSPIPLVLLRDVDSQLNENIGSLEFDISVKDLDLKLLFLSNAQELVRSLLDFLEYKEHITQLSIATDAKIQKFMGEKSVYDQRISEINDIDALCQILRDSNPVTEDNFSLLRSVILKLRFLHTRFLIDIEFDREKTARVSGQLQKEMGYLLTELSGAGVYLNAGADGEELEDTILLDFLKVADAKEEDSAILKISNRELNHPNEIKDWVRMMAMLTAVDSDRLKTLMNDAKLSAKAANKPLKVTDLPEEVFEIFEKIIAVFLAKFGTDLEIKRIKSSIISGGTNMASTGDHFAVHLTCLAKLRDPLETRLVPIPLEFQIRLFEDEDDHEVYKQIQFSEFAKKMAMNVNFEQYILGMMVALDVRKGTRDKYKNKNFNFMIDCLLSYLTLRDPETKRFVNIESFKGLVRNKRNMAKIRKTFGKIEGAGRLSKLEIQNLKNTRILLEILHLRHELDEAKSNGLPNVAQLDFLNNFHDQAYFLYEHFFKKEGLDDDLDSLENECSELITSVVELIPSIAKGQSSFEEGLLATQKILKIFEGLLEDDIVPLDANSDGADGATD
ncbi:hypothetical protein KJ632_00045, partial [Patescibacteria group bacterium]|nr:hypothetical protein [Patescibacteria group bacterium]